MISDHATQWLGLPVVVLDEDLAAKGITDYTGVIYRIATSWDGPDFEELFAAFVANPKCAEAPAVIIGSVSNDGGQEMITALELLVAARQKLAGVRGIFFGDIIVEESEISWITQTDVSPLFTAYPNIEHLRVRGGEGLALGENLQHAKLKSLIIETGGLRRELLRQVAKARLPELEHLELWLGEEGYGGDATLEDLRPFFASGLFPKLKRLGLCNSTFQDDIAIALAVAPVLAQLQVLDLSLGTLSDKGGEALLASPGIKALTHLDLHHHYLSAKMQERLAAALPSVDLSEQESADEEDDRYISHSE